jgi:hypothetical protein
VAQASEGARDRRREASRERARIAREICRRAGAATPRETGTTAGGSQHRDRAFVESRNDQHPSGATSADRRLHSFAGNASERCNVATKAALVGVLEIVCCTIARVCRAGNAVGAENALVGVLEIVCSTVVRLRRAGNAARAENALVGVLEVRLGAYARERRGYAGRPARTSTAACRDSRATRSIRTAAT